MIWLSEVSPVKVLHAYIASVVALFFFGIIASLQQDKYMKKRTGKRALRRTNNE